MVKYTDTKTEEREIGSHFNETSRTFAMGQSFQFPVNHWKLCQKIYKLLGHSVYLNTEHYFVSFGHFLAKNGQKVMS